MNSLERLLVAAVVFFGGLTFCLPVPPNDFVVFPWWAKRIDIGKVVLHEALFMVWLVLFGAKRLPRIFNHGSPLPWRAVKQLSLLAIWCGVVSLLFSPLPDEDLGRSMRLILNAILLLSVIDWIQRAGLFVLVALICGFNAGTIINLEITYSLPDVVIDGVRRLAGQNTPGVGMGIAIHAAAWLFFLSNRAAFRIIAIGTVLVCGYGCGISFSRVGWLTGGAGILAWVWISVYGAGNDVSVRRNARRIAQALALLLFIGLVSTLFAPVQDTLWDIAEVFQQKDWVESQSNDYRLAYFPGVFEIIVSHPLGVGYSGFFDAMRNTEIYESGRASVEDGFDANPHSGFLYYASAGGLIGFALCITAFFYLLRCFRHGFSIIFSKSANAIYLLIVFSYITVGMTVPYMFNSIILIVPVGIIYGLAIRKAGDR